MSHQAGSDLLAQWTAVRSVYPIYAAVAKEFSLDPPPYDDLDAVESDAEVAATKRVQQWLGELDARIQPHQFRLILERTDILNSEDKLRALARRHLAKKNRTDADRDKLHYLLSQYLFICSPPSFRSRELSLAEVAHVLEPVLGECAAYVPESLQPLKALCDRMSACRSLAEFQSSILNAARESKSSMGEMYFGATALAVVTHFNHCAKRSFASLWMSEVQETEAGLDKLQARGVDAIDATGAGLSTTEGLLRIRELVKRLKTSTPPAYLPFGLDLGSHRVRALRLAVEAAVSDAIVREEQDRLVELKRELKQLRQEVIEARQQSSTF